MAKITKKIGSQGLLTVQRHLSHKALLISNACFPKENNRKMPIKNPLCFINFSHSNKNFKYTYFQCTVLILRILKILNFTKVAGRIKMTD